MNFELDGGIGKDEGPWESDVVVLECRSAGRWCLLCLHLTNTQHI
jgi:hypothetical protein